MTKSKFIRKYGFISFFLYTSVSLAQVNKCNLLFSSEKIEKQNVNLSKRQKIGEQYLIIKTQVLELLASNKLESILLTNEKPTWDDYNIIKNLIYLIKNKQSGKTNRIAYLNSAERAQLQVDIKDLKSILNEKLKYISEKLKDSNSRFQYTRFLDYHIAYYRLLAEVNRLSNVDIFPLPNLNLIKSDTVLKSEAEKLISKLELTTETTFSLSGHINLEEFEKYTAAFSPLANRRLKLIKDELVVSMHRPEKARFWIPLAGFQNQRITGSSKGRLYSDSTPGKISGRDRAEATLTQTDLDEYVSLSARFKPNYAEARPDVSVTDTKPNTGACQYGSDLWIIKKSVIEKRATWTPNDSLVPGWQAIKNNSFDDIFIPWKYRSLMVPFSLTSTHSMNPSYFPSNFKFDNLKRWSNGYDYFEVQIFGPLTIEDVQAFHFQNNPPNKELYDILISKGIEIWDERTWPAKKYNSNESK